MTGVFAPRCSHHVGLEPDAPFFDWTTPDTTDATPPALVPFTDLTFHDALWMWLNVGGGGRIDIRRIDTDALSPFSTC